MKIPLNLRGNHYTCRLIENHEVVQGNYGNYFLIDLYQSNYKKVLHFPEGKFEIFGFEKYQSALTEFGEEIVNLLVESGYSPQFQVYVKGSADFLGNDSFNKEVGPDIQGKEICFFAKSGRTEHIFTPNLTCYLIPETIVNADLPNLRASFVRDKFRNFYSSTMNAPIILDGSVSSQISFRDRNVTILLFIQDSFFTN